jgi:hypothetical protein
MLSRQHAARQGKDHGARAGAMTCPPSHAPDGSSGIVW